MVKPPLVCTASLFITHFHRCADHLDRKLIRNRNERHFKLSELNRYLKDVLSTSNRAHILLKCVENAVHYGSYIRPQKKY